MKRITITLLAVLAVISLTTGCKTKVKPLSEIIGRVWVAQVVKEGSATVYTKGAATNVKAGYASYRLDLSSPTSGSLTEVDNNKFTGKWAVTESASGNTLTLTELSPQPTGTNGTIVFTINASSETELTLTRTAASQKTGGTVNNYTLVTP
jgi:hypothetical protein